jgi:hypothetical protein
MLGGAKEHILKPHGGLSEAGVGQFSYLRHSSVDKPDHVFLSGCDNDSCILEC